MFMCVQDKTLTVACLTGTPEETDPPAFDYSCRYGGASDFSSARNGPIEGGQKDAGRLHCRIASMVCQEKGVRACCFFVFFVSFVCVCVEVPLALRVLLLC
jgi:hypothetical protein